MNRSTQLRELLDEHRTLTLAVADGDGPWAADVYYVRVGTALWFFSKPDARHSRAVDLDPRAAGTVHAEASGWRDIRGVQMEGEVAPVTAGEERDRAVKAYLAKFPFAKPLLVGELLAKVRFYRFTPARTYWIDNEEGLGGRVEVEP
ncbi:MAG: pyridoxamine 5'-phosphate oxidase family protein [Planctomycetota bacterium]